MQVHEFQYGPTHKQAKLVLKIENKILTFRTISKQQKTNNKHDQRVVFPLGVADYYLVFEINNVWSLGINNQQQCENVLELFMPNTILTHMQLLRKKFLH